MLAEKLNADIYTQASYDVGKALQTAKDLLEICGRLNTPDMRYATIYYDMFQCTIRDPSKFEEAKRYITMSLAYQKKFMNPFADKFQTRLEEYVRNPTSHSLCRKRLLEEKN